MNPARVAALRLGMGEDMVAFTVQINCGSGMQSIDTAYRYIREGHADMILAGGTEALSHAPLVWPNSGVRWFAGLATAKGVAAKLAAAFKLRPRYLKPIIGLERGLTDPITDLNMGQTAEVVGHLFGITRAQSDAYAAESHRRLAHAQAEGFLKGEVETAFSRDGKFFDHDDGVRPNFDGRDARKAEAGVRASLGPGHRRQFLADHRRCLLGDPRLRRGGRKAQTDAEGCRSSTATGPRSIRASWGWGR